MIDRITKIETVNIKAYQGRKLSWNLNIISGPKFSIQCGKCESWFKERIPLVPGQIKIKCPHCGTVNNTNLQYKKR